MLDLARARTARLANAAARASQLIVYPDGTRIYPDSPPGIGWVLAMPDRPKRYLRNVDEAKADYERLR